MSSVLVSYQAAVRSIKNKMGHPVCSPEIHVLYNVVGCIANEPFVKAIRNDKIRVGTKLITFGAELINQNQACTPLEAPPPNDPEVVEDCIVKNSQTVPLLRYDFT